MLDLVNTTTPNRENISEFNYS